jgi:hypothetical protein
MRVYGSIILAALAASAAADDSQLPAVAIEVLSIGVPVPLVDKPLPVTADPLMSPASPLIPNGALFASQLRANSSQMGAVAGSTISNLGQSLIGAMAPAGPALTLGNTVGAPRLR